MNIINLINLTPHPITIRPENGEPITVPPSGTVARVATVEEDAGQVAGVPVITRAFGEVTGLPAPAEDTIYLVSSLVLSAVRDRQDVYAPDTGATAIRDEEGRIVAVTRLVRAGGAA